MNKIFRFFRLKGNPYIVIFLLMMLTAISLITYFGWREYDTYYHNINEHLAAETERVERTFTDIADHTAFMMKVMIMQIRTKPHDLQHISNIIRRYSVDSRLNNVLSWTHFMWFDKNHVKRVDGISGIQVENADYSTREYLKKAKSKPGRIHLGAPSFGSASQRYKIPVTLGVINQSDYLGTLSTSFDLINLSNTLSNAIKDNEIYFALLDEDLDIVMQSPNNFSSYNTHPINVSNLREFIDDHNVTFDNLTRISSIDLMFDGDNHYLYKVPDYPFVVYLHYDNKLITEKFWRNIIYRVLEVFAVSIAMFFLIVWIYNRERDLREKVEHSKKLADEAFQAKTDFLAYTAHEFRSPLGFIISGTELMLRKAFGPLEEKYYEYTQGIHKSSLELLEFIDDLLDNMRVGPSNFTVNPEFIDVREVLSRSVKGSNIIYNYKIHIEVQLPKELPMLYADPKRLLQVFNNIISNAIKYSPADSLLSIEIKMHKGNMAIYFIDSGYGMDKEDLARSMQKYGTTKANNSKDLRERSIGLGLSLVKKLVALMGAKFFIDSEVNKGTSVLVVFPKTKVKNTDQVPIEEAYELA